jgi:hypothetical protein
MYPIISGIVPPPGTVIGNEFLFSLFLQLVENNIPWSAHTNANNECYGEFTCRGLIWNTPMIFIADGLMTASVPNIPASCRVDYRQLPPNLGPFS